MSLSRVTSRYAATLFAGVLLAGTTVFWAAGVQAQSAPEINSTLPEIIDAAGSLAKDSSGRIQLDERELYLLKGTIEVLEDKSGTLKIADVRTSADFQPARTNTPSYGFTDSVYWARLRLRNPGAETRRMYLEVSMPALNRIEYFVFAGDRPLRHFLTGNDFPFSRRDAENRNYVFRLPVEPGAERDVFLRFESRESMIFPLWLFSEDGFIASIYRRLFVQGAYFGILIVMVLYNLILYFSYRDRNYLFYILYILSFLMIQLNISGFAYQVFWPEHIAWNKISGKFFTGLTCFWAIMFARSFLSVRRYSLLLDRVLMLWLFVSLGLCLVSLFEYERIGAILTNIVALSMVLLLLAAGSYVAWRGYHPARYFLLAFGMLIAGAVLLTLMFLGVLPGGFITRYGLQIGSGLEMVLLSLGLRDRIITARLEKEADERRHTESRLRLLDSFARFVPRQFLDHLGRASLEEVAPGDAVRQEITVLFNDLRGFTALSESMSVEDNFRFINSYVQIMQPVINEQNGFIDKFIGDAIMALFTAPDDALRAALGMRAALDKFNEDRLAQNQAVVEMGIGLNTGELMLGTVGTADRMDTTVIGDSVNLASRLESLTSRYKTPILISEYVVARLKEPERFILREIDLVRVKGKQHPVHVFELIGATVGG